MTDFLRLTIHATSGLARLTSEKTADLFTSALTPVGPVAESIDFLYWFMVWTFGAVFAVTLALLFIALVLKRPLAGLLPRAPLGDNPFIVIAGLLVPGIILCVTLIYTIQGTAALKVPKDALEIKVTGYMWWWDVEYPETGIRLANEVYVPVGRPVRIALEAGDVIHSLWVPSLGGKKDLIPGRTNIHWFEATRPGHYRGQCAEFCGLQHAKMALFIVALPEEEYRAWVEAKKISKTVPETEVQKLGYETYFKVGCNQCHAIRGTPSTARLAPDLTHIGSRTSLGAGAIPNHYGSLAGWIANSQAIKPGNKMPAYYIETPEFHALVTYLMALK